MLAEHPNMNSRTLLFEFLEETHWQYVSAMNFWLESDFSLCSSKSDLEMTELTESDLDSEDSVFSDYSDYSDQRFHPNMRFGDPFRDGIHRHAMKKRQRQRRRERAAREGQQSQNLSPRGGGGGGGDDQPAMPESNSQVEENSRIIEWVKEVHETPAGTQPPELNLDEVVGQTQPEAKQPQPDTDQECHTELEWQDAVMELVFRRSPYNHVCDGKCSPLALRLIHCLGENGQMHTKSDIRCVAEILAPSAAELVQAIIMKWYAPFADGEPKEEVEEMMVCYTAVTATAAAIMMWLHGQGKIDIEKLCVRTLMDMSRFVVHSFQRKMQINPPLPPRDEVREVIMDIFAPPPPQDEEKSSSMWPAGDEQDDFSSGASFVYTDEDSEPRGTGERSKQMFTVDFGRICTVTGKRRCHPWREPLMDPRVRQEIESGEPIADFENRSFDVSFRWDDGEERAPPFGFARPSPWS